MKLFKMDHVAILRKSCVKKGDDLLGDILAGEKTIESRWYVNRIAPWNKIEAGETVYLKESGCPVTAKAEVSKVLQYDSLTSEIIKEIVEKYSKKLSPSTTKKEFYEWAKGQKKKRYLILIFLENAREIEPFEIDKAGYGMACAWLVTEDINKIRV